MSYDEKKMIEDVEGDLAPQYFNESENRYEDLRGANGASFSGNHVLSPSGIWIPQTGQNGKANVYDETVKQELEQIKAVQDDILAKLNGTINTDFSGNINIENAVIDNTPENPLYTQVTGSVVELFNETVEVSAGAFVGVTPDYWHNGDYKQAFCTVIADTAHDFEARLQFREGSHNMIQYTNDNDKSNTPVANNLQIILPKNFITERVRVSIINNDEEAHTYRIRLGAIL